MFVKKEEIIMAMIEISDLAFPAFNEIEMEKLPEEYGIEFFYEFGSDSYWDVVLQRMRADKKTLSIHGPCVTVNLADPNDTAYLERYKKTFAYAKKTGTKYVVVHTNEQWSGDVEFCRQLVLERLRRIELLANELDGAQMGIENVGLKQNNLFDEEAYVALFEEFQTAGAIIDVGHAHINHWDTCRVITALNRRISAFHLQDNDGKTDEHLPLFAGTIDWQKLIETIKQHAPQAAFVFEYADGNYKNAAELIKELDIVRKKLKI
jgi:sugar phosphate isomerase/epimerase